MASLQELRQKLDEVDDQIVKLYEERMSICEQVGEYKISAGRKVLDRQREKEKLQDVHEQKITVQAACEGRSAGTPSVYRDRGLKSTECPNCFSRDRRGLRTGSHAELFWQRV